MVCFADASGAADDKNVHISNVPKSTTQELLFVIFPTALTIQMPKDGREKGSVKRSVHISCTTRLSTNMYKGEGTRNILHCQQLRQLEKDANEAEQQQRRYIIYIEMIIPSASGPAARKKTVNQKKSQEDEQAASRKPTLQLVIKVPE
ncbi:hypothetical protein BaRGS_00006686 [Batillaria attramentaria]|uniref:Uncharacterized protein n=1 Tax=Batillaria attramentaria TaxID=370345 RepID=A0ABD0LQH3_9CAEN